VFDAAEVPERPRRISQGVLSVIAPLLTIVQWRDVFRSGRFQDPERDDATGKDTMAAGTGWDVTVTA